MKHNRPIAFFLYILLTLAPCLSFAQKQRGMPVLFTLKEEQVGEPILGATYTIKCEGIDFADHRGTPSDTFQTMRYEAGKVLRYCIERKGYKTKTGVCTVAENPAQNTHVVYLERHEAPVKSIEVQGTLYFVAGGNKILIPHEEVTIAGLANKKSAVTDDMGRYRITFKSNEILDPADGFTIKICRTSAVFLEDARRIMTSNSQNYEDFKLNHLFVDDAIVFRLFDPRGDTNVAGATVQVFAENKLVGEAVSDRAGFVNITPSLDHSVEYVKVTVRINGLPPLSFKLPVAELNSPYLLNQRLFTRFAQTYGYRQSQFSLGVVTDVRGTSRMLSAEAAYGIGKAPKLFVGFLVSPTAVDSNFFRDVRNTGPVVASHPRSSRFQVPIGLFVKQYTHHAQPKKINYFGAVASTLRWADPSINPGRLHLGTRLSAGFRYPFSQKWGFEFSVMANASVWDYKIGDYNSSITVNSLMLQIRFDYCRQW